LYILQVIPTAILLSVVKRILCRDTLYNSTESIMLGCHYI